MALWWVPKSMMPNVGSTSPACGSNPRTWPRWPSWPMSPACWTETDCSCTISKGVAHGPYIGLLCPHPPGRLLHRCTPGRRLFPAHGHRRCLPPQPAITAGIGLRRPGVAPGAAPGLFPRFGTWVARTTGFSGGRRIGLTQIDFALQAIHEGESCRTDLARVSRNAMPVAYADMIYAFIIEEWGCWSADWPRPAVPHSLFPHHPHRARCPVLSAFAAIGLGLMLTFRPWSTWASPSSCCP